MPYVEPEDEKDAVPTVLAEAEDLVYQGDRQKDYGHPRENFGEVAVLWNAYLRGRGFEVDMDAADASQLLLLLTVARFSTGGRKRDTVVDQAGYAAVTARIIGLDD